MIAPVISSPATKRWFVTCTRPHQEATAVEHLRRQDYNAWYPRQRRTRRHARRFDTILAPFFPGYVFVEMNPATEPWRRINGTFGVRHLICGRDGPLPLPDGFVASLRARTDDDVIREASPGFKPGDEVRVVSGPFVDCIGTLLRSDEADRVRLLLRLINGDVKAVLPMSAVVPVA